MEAISNTILSIAKNGDNIISGNHLFGHTYALFQQTLPELGIDIRFSNLRNKLEIEKLVNKSTRAIFFETVTNPQLEIADILMLSQICKKYNLLLIADSTITPPNIFSASKFGVNIEVISTTKYISGGATSFGGAIVDHGNYN
jgi:O-acetylhomoserine (thiol)-lyase